MTTEKDYEKRALAWALNQDYPSVAARNAKILARLAERLRKENVELRLEIINMKNDR